MGRGHIDQWYERTVHIFYKNKMYFFYKNKLYKSTKVLTRKYRWRWSVYVDLMEFKWLYNFNPEFFHTNEASLISIKLDVLEDKENVCNWQRSAHHHNKKPGNNELMRFFFFWKWLLNKVHSKMPFIVIVG